MSRKRGAASRLPGKPRAFLAVNVCTTSDVRVELYGYRLRLTAKTVKTAKNQHDAMLKTSISRWIRPLLLAAALFAPAPASAANEDEFLAARDAFRAGDARKLDYHAR